MIQSDHTAISASLSEAGRYSRRSISRSEFIYGKGFQSPGGLRLTKLLSSDPMLRSSFRNVLDVGMGLGGSAAFLSVAHNVPVTGIDNSSSILGMAGEHLASSAVDSVTCIEADATQPNLFPASKFDLIWIRDSLLYIPSRVDVLQLLRGYLAPGGQLVLTDFGIGARPTAAFRQYASDCGYHLWDFDTYRDALETAGFSIQHANDWSDQYLSETRAELEHLEANRSEFETTYSAKEYEHMHKRWSSKIAFSTSGDFRYFRFLCSHS